MREPYRYEVLVREPKVAGHGDIPGFLDMLRYDGATVEQWDWQDTGVYRVRLASPRPPTVARWRSMGIGVKELA